MCAKKWKKNMMNLEKEEKAERGRGRKKKQINNYDNCV